MTNENRQPETCSSSLIKRLHIKMFLFNMNIE